MDKRSHQPVQHSNRTADVDIGKPENLRQRKKETLKQHNRKFSAQQNSNANVSTSRRQDHYQGKKRLKVTISLRNAKVYLKTFHFADAVRQTNSPPVPALQKNNLDRPAIPARNKKTQNASVPHNDIHGHYSHSQVPESSRTQPTVVSSRYMDPNS